jgi:hypothetical protein
MSIGIRVINGRLEIALRKWGREVRDSKILKDYVDSLSFQKPGEHKRYKHRCAILRQRYNEQHRETPITRDNTCL